MSLQSFNAHYLTELESETITIFRECAAECEKPVLLFSGGKDSIVLLHIALKAFRPARLPFPLLHVDTGHNFPETIEFRDRKINEIGEKLIVASVQETIDQGLASEEISFNASRNRIQSVTLLNAIEKNGFDAAIGGARRDEERARAKERIFSHRDEFGQWNPKNQRPELWSLYNGRVRKGEHLRVFPISNWTEMDVWHYIQMEKIDLPDLYFAKERPVFERDGFLRSPAPFIKQRQNEKIEMRKVRFRTIGDMTCTAAIPSNAETLEEIIHEIGTLRITERGHSRTDDLVTEAAMEDRKIEGYF